MTNREPTYDSGINILKLYLLLNDSGRPLSMNTAKEHLGVSEKTIQRYVDAINEYIPSTNGGRLIKRSTLAGEKFLLMEKNE